MKRLTDALFTLINMVEAGHEYPTAHEKVCLLFNLTVKQGEMLTIGYDSYCTGKGN